jgi:putative iron-only hydrogenase system regulator
LQQSGIRKTSKVSPATRYFPIGYDFDRQAAGTKRVQKTPVSVHFYSFLRQGAVTLTQGKRTFGITVCVAANRLRAPPQKCGGAFFLRKEQIVEKRLGFVGIIIEERATNAAAVNELLGNFGHLIVARMGVPYEKRSCSAITLIVDATTDELGKLTGKLGALPGVSVKSMLSKER